MSHTREKYGTWCKLKVSVPTTADRKLGVFGRGPYVTVTSEGGKKYHMLSDRCQPSGTSEKTGTKWKVVAIWCSYDSRRGWVVPVTVAPLCAKNQKRGAKMGCTKIVLAITFEPAAVPLWNLPHLGDIHEGYPLVKMVFRLGVAVTSQWRHNFFRPSKSKNSYLFPLVPLRKSKCARELSIH